MSPVKPASQLEARIEALEIKVDALMAANTVLRGITQRVEEIYQPAPQNDVMSQPPQPKADPDPSWEPILHVRNTPLAGQTPSQVRPACHQPAQYIIHKVDPETPGDLELLRVRGPSESFWHAPRQGEASLCSSCYAPVQSTSSENLDWSRAFLEPQVKPPLPNPRRNNAARRRRSAPEPSVRVQLPLDLETASTGATPPQGPPDAAPESISPDEILDPTPAKLSGKFTPEAAADTLERLQQLAKAMGHSGS